MLCQLVAELYPRWSDHGRLELIKIHIRKTQGSSFLGLLRYPSIVRGQCRPGPSNRSSAVAWAASQSCGHDHDHAVAILVHLGQDTTFAFHSFQTRYNVRRGEILHFASIPDGRQPWQFQTSQVVENLFKQKSDLHSELDVQSARIASKPRFRSPNMRSTEEAGLKTPCHPNPEFARQFLRDLIVRCVWYGTRWCLVEW
jgi:hypothetical protein